VRSLLGVRVIQGSLQTNRDNYFLLASSSKGETWVTQFPLTPTFLRTLAPSLVADSPPVPLVSQSEAPTLDLLLTHSNGTTETLSIPIALSGEVDPLLEAEPLSTSAITTTEPVTLPVGLQLRMPLTFQLGITQTVITPLASEDVLTITIAPDSAIHFQGLSDSYPFAVVLQEDLSMAVGFQPADVVANLADELAFQIISGDPALASLGMTKSWEAYQPFRRGLEAMQRYEAGQFDSLTTAIREFRSSTLQDPSFALAHYRLGLALQLDGQPSAAAEAFQASIAANPRFVPAYNVLAYDLYDFDSYYGSTPAKAAPLTASSEAARNSHAAEARRLWQQIVLFAPGAASLPDRASAYVGLCLDARDHAALDPQRYPLGYFYCQQAERLYTELSPALRSDLRIQQAEAQVLNLLGVVLEERQPNWKVETVDTATDWHCAWQTIVAETMSPDGVVTERLRLHSPYSRAAHSYYERALALQPKDLDIRCNAASAAYALGDASAMSTLQADAGAHLALGDKYSALAKEATFTTDATRPSPYYDLALDAYQSAIDRDPNNLWALNGYAYTFWEWYLAWPQGAPPAGSADVAVRAELYARRAVRLAADKQPAVTQAIVHSTLGEVLFVLEQWPEAADELRQARKLAPSHPLYDEIRWDSAQVYLCAAARGGETGLSTQATELLVTSLLRDIRRNEATREVQPFTESNLLDGECQVP
jgi:tetratricopeptide (TPR) repeat protein